MFVFNFFVLIGLMVNFSVELSASEVSSVSSDDKSGCFQGCNNPTLQAGCNGANSFVKSCSQKFADGTGFELVRDCNCAKVGIGGVTLGAMTALVVCAAKVGLGSNDVYTLTSVRNDCSHSVIVGYPGCKNGDCQVILYSDDQTTIRSFGSLGQLCVKGIGNFFYEACATKNSLKKCEKFSITQDSGDYVFNALCQNPGINTNSSVKYYKSSEYTGPYTSDIANKNEMLKELQSRGNLRGFHNE